MPSSTSSDGIEWFRYPFVATHDLAKTWLTTETLPGLAPNTLDAYTVAKNSRQRLLNERNSNVQLSTSAWNSWRTRTSIICPLSGS
jgi:hypothetical protein